jgi:hypothetical protein
MWQVKTEKILNNIAKTLKPSQPFEKPKNPTLPALLIPVHNGEMPYFVH